MYVSNLGGRCMGHYSLSEHAKDFDKNIENIDCPTGNMVFLDGFCGLHKLFDGTFKKTLFADEIKVRYIIYRGDGESYVLDGLRVVHGNPLDNKFISKLKKRWDGFFNIFNDKEKSNDMLFFYTLNEYDLLKSHRQIENERKKLSKYFNIERLFILASTPIDNPKYKNFKYNYKNSNFKDIFKEHYFEICPSNDHYLACQEIIKKIKGCLKQ